MTQPGSNGRPPGGTRGEHGLAGGTPVERVPCADAVGHVEVRAGRLDHGDREGVGTVDDREVRGGTDAVGEAAQRGDRGLAQDGLDLPREREDGHAEAAPAVATATQQGVLLERDDEAVDDGAGDAELRGDLGDGEPVRGVGQELEHGQSAIEGLAGLRDHLVTSGTTTVQVPAVRRSGPPSVLLPLCPTLPERVRRRAPRSASLTRP